MTRLTRKIGRYEILGPLATGGMAEILLARLVGPSGFERPVVLKRIRPDLDHAELTSLFLEEARVAAKVRHANVVAVEDLGTDDGAPYLVMEYLEGESLSNVTRRLVSRDAQLPFGLTAYAIAEACAGLHAAHELRGVDEQLVGLVHRDVSPQNLFVTYDGAVKVVDFGIAHTDATHVAEAGAIRGKFGYIAPEQFSGEALDRRTDVFALGVILHELLTGHRLFKRFSQAATIRAVLTDPIVSPRRVNPDVPPELEAICMRALSRPREARYATAAEMRRELLLAMRELASEEPSAELAELMRRCFPDRIGEKRELLRNVREGSIVDHIPVGDIDVTIEIPGLPVFDDSPNSARAPASNPDPPVPDPPRIPDPPSLVAHTAAPLPRPQTPTLVIERHRRRYLWVGTLTALAGVATGVALRYGIAHGSARSAERAIVPSSEGATSPAGAPTSRVSVTNAQSNDSDPSTDTPSPGAAQASSIAASTTSAPSAPSSTTPSSRAEARPLRKPRSSGAASQATAASPSPAGATAIPAPTPAAPSASTRGFRRFQ